MKWLAVPGQANRLTSMEGLRAYAAFIVFLFHAALMTQEHQWLSGPVIDWMLHSQYGVDVFFILSGYLIAGLAAKPGFRFGSYLLHRVVRIYPALLGMFAICIAGMIYLRGETLTPAQFAANIFLINKPLDVQPINNVTWSLMFEFAFYLTFPPLYRRFGLRGAAIITAAAIVPLAYWDMTYLRFMFFFAGAAMKLNQAQLPKIKEPLVIACYLAVTTATIYLGSLFYFTLLFLPVATMLVHKALHERGVLHAIFSVRPLRTLGNISYSFYLLHPVGLLVGRIIAERLALDGVAWAATVACIGFAVSFAMAGVSFALLERPYFLYRHLLERKAPKLSAAAAADVTPAR